MVKFNSHTDSSIFDDNKNLHRDEWPFKDMSVGQVISFDGDLGVKAQKRVHAYGVMYSMKFKTRKDKTSGRMFIKRIA
jgi:hypothetical protein